NWATPAEPFAGRVPLGQATVSPRPSVHTVGDAFCRKPVRLLVEPEPESRRTMAMSAPGRLETLGLSALIIGSFHLVILRSKMLGRVSALKFSDVTPCTWNTIASGATTIGQYSVSLPANFALSSADSRLSDPAKA